ncbi:MAG: ATP-binding protein, partial [Candidatus Altiarchaeales archaeon]|nr:ATP-binding protein [Candidatus Altiarchaeales archaeon]
MEEEIRNKILRRNTWWATGGVADTRLRDYRRPVFDKITERLENKRIISLNGLRRVGKTTLMYQTVDYLLHNKTNPKDILFISFDEIITADHQTFDEIYEWYLTRIRAGKTKEKTYVFIDEIHFLPQWNRTLKSYHDNHPNIKFIISGSASIRLQKGHRESLAGRIDDILILPFTFREIIELTGIDLDSNRLNPKDLEKTYIEIPEETKLQIKALFEKYILFGGLPEAYIENYTIDLWQEYLFNDVIKKIIYEDMVSTYNIRRPASLVKLLKYFAYNLTGYYEATNIGNHLDMNRDMVEYYLNYLTQTLLVFLLPKVGKEGLRSREKMYMGDVGIRNAILGVDGDGRVVENMIFLHLLPLKPRYWKNTLEVDFIVETNDALIPIESKHVNKVRKHDIRGLLEFMKKFSCNKGIILTKNSLNGETLSKQTIAHIPVWLLLLLPPEDI